ncbi:hypothetical protein WJX82_002577 [Trebouxia sp. C0006]
MYESAQYYNSHGNSPNQYAMELVGALDASGVPLIVELPQTDGDPPMFSSSALPEVDNDFVTAMHWALEDGAYRAFGYIFMGSISYDPIPNGGEGALGQSNCASAIEDVIDTANGTVIVQGAYNATTGDLEEAGGAFEAHGLTAFVSGNQRRKGWSTVRSNSLTSAIQVDIISSSTSTGRASLWEYAESAKQLTQVAAGWRKSRAGDGMVCTWCYPRKARGNSASAINDNQATSSPELLTRRAAWEEAQVHANAMAVSDAGHHAPIDATPKERQQAQEGNGRVFGRVPTAKRSRKQSSADVHQKGSQRQRRKSVLHEDPDLGTLQTPELAGIPKPRQYRDINTVTSELQTQDKVLIKLSSCGEMINVQLLANPAAVAQVNVDAKLLVVVDPRLQLNPQVPMFGRDNLRKLLVQEEAKRMDAAITRLKHSNRIKSQEQALRNSIVKYHSSVDKAAKQLGRACATQKALLQSAAGASNTTQFVRQAEEGLAAAVDEAGSLLDTVPVIRGWLQAQLQDCLASCSDSQGHEGIAGQGTLILDPGVVEILSLHKKGYTRVFQEMQASKDQRTIIALKNEADAAVVRATRGLQETIAGKEEQIQRLKHAAANAQPVVQQLSQAFRLLHAVKIERSADSRSIAVLSREVQHLREVNQAQGRQLASARAHMEAQAVAAAAQHQQTVDQQKELTQRLEAMTISADNDHAALLAAQRSCDDAEAEKAVLQGEVQAALDQKVEALDQMDAALEQQARLQELLASAERRAATAATAEKRVATSATAEPESHGNNSTKPTEYQIKAEYGPNMPGGADRLPEQTLEQGTGEVGTPNLQQDSPQGQAESGVGVSAAGSALASSKANEAGWAGRDYEEGTIKKVPSLKPSERPPSIGRRPIKARRGALEAGHVQEQTPDMHLRDTAAGGGQQQGAEDVLPKAHTKSQKMVQQQPQPLSSAASPDDALLTGGRAGEVVINAAGLDAAGKGLSPAGSSPGVQGAADKRVDLSRRQPQAQEYSTKAAGGSNTALADPSRTVSSPLPSNAATAESAAAPSTTSVSPSPLTAATAAAAGAIASSPGTASTSATPVSQRDVLAYQQQEEEAAMKAKVESGSFLTELVSRQYKDQVRKHVKKVFQGELETRSLEAFLDDLVQMTSQADIVRTCIAQGGAEEAATQLAELLIKKEKFATQEYAGRRAQSSAAGVASVAAQGLSEGASGSGDAVGQEGNDSTATLAQPETFQTWARGELMALSKGKLRFADTLLDCLLDGKTEEEVARDCTANLHCGKEKAMTFAVELFRRRQHDTGTLREADYTTVSSSNKAGRKPGR